MEQGLFPELPLLVVDDEKHFLSSIDFILQTNEITNLEYCHDSRDVMLLLKKKKFSVILLDLLMPNISGEELLQEIVDQYPEIPIIIVTAHADIELARECMKKGALDYLIKPFETKDLLRKINVALNLKNFNKEIILTKKELFSEDHKKMEIFPDIISRSKKMKEIFQVIGLAAHTLKPILIQGETGAGKEFIAREIHKQSRRKGEFIIFNTTGMDDDSFDELLVGNKKKLLVNPEKVSEGLLEKAQDGTLFINEIANLPLPSQSKLLQLIKELEYLPTSSEKPIPASVRIITATDKNLSTLTNTGAFRQDLYLLLKANDITIPPLRDHKEDIPLLVDYFIETAAEKIGIKKPQVTPEIYNLLEQYDFPGNISELKDMVFEAISRNISGDLSADVFLENIKMSAKGYYKSIDLKRR